MKIQWLISGVAVTLLAGPAMASPTRRASPSLFKSNSDKYRHNYRDDLAHQDKRDYRSLPKNGGAATTTADALRTTSTPTIYGYTTSPVSLITSASSVSAYAPSGPSISEKPLVVTITTTVTAIYSSSTSSAVSSGYFITSADSSTPVAWNHTSIVTLSFPTNTSSALALSTGASSSTLTSDTCHEEPTPSLSSIWSSSYYPLPTSSYSDYSYSFSYSYSYSSSGSSYSSYDGTSSAPYYTPASSVPLPVLTTVPLSSAPSASASSSFFSSARWTNTSSQVTVTTTTTITYAATTQYTTTEVLAHESSSIFILTAAGSSIPIPSAPFLNSTTSLPTLSSFVSSLTAPSWLPTGAPSSALSSISTNASSIASSLLSPLPSITVSSAVASAPGPISSWAPLLSSVFVPPASVTTPLISASASATVHFDSGDHPATSLPTRDAWTPSSLPEETRHAH